MPKTLSDQEFQVLVQKVQVALERYRERPGPGSRSEPRHVKHGPEVHFGVSRRRGRHFGTKNRGLPEHLYDERWYRGDSRKGEGGRLTPKQRAKIADLFLLRKKLRTKVRGHYRKTEGGWVRVQAYKRTQLPPKASRASRSAA